MRTAIEPTARALHPVPPDIPPRRRSASLLVIIAVALVLAVLTGSMLIAERTQSSIYDGYWFDVVARQVVRLEEQWVP